MAVTVEELEIIIRANVDDAIKKMDKFKQRLKSTLAAQLPQMKAQIEAVKPIVDQYGNTLQSALKKAETPMKQAAKQVQEATAKVEKAVTSTAKVQEAAAQKAAAAEKAKVDAAKRADKEYEAIFQRMKARQNDGGGHYQSTFAPAPSTPAKTATAISSKKEPTASNASPMAKTMDELRSKINAVKPQFEQMKQAAIAAFDNPAAERLKAQLDIINAKLQNQKALYRQLLSQHESVSADKGEDSPQALGIEKKIIGADEAITKMVDRAREIEAAFKRAVEPTEEIKTAAKSAEPPIKKVKKETDNATNATKKYERQVRKTGGVSVTIFQRIGRSIRGMLVSLLSYKAIGAIFRSLREGIQNMAQASGSVNNTMSRLSTSFLYAKNSIAAAFMPAIQALTPAITFLADKLAELFNIVGMVTARLFGNATMFTQAKKAQTDYAAGLGKMGDSAEKAGKKAQRSVLGFDQLNKLQAPEGNTSSGDNGVAQPSQMFEQVKMPDNIIKFVDKLKVAFQPVSEALGRLKGQLDRLGQFAWAGLKDFWETFLKPLGKWTLGVGLPRFIDAITKGLAAIDWGKINNSLHGLWEALEPFAENVGEGLLWLWENVIIPFGTWVMNDVVPVFIDILAGAIDSINETIETVKPAFLWLWDNFLKPVAVWTGGVIVDVLKGIAKHMDLLGPAIMGVVTAMALFWLAQKTKAAWEALSKGIQTAKTAFKGLNAVMTANPIGVIVTIIGVLVAAFIWLWENCEGFREFWLNLWDNIKNICASVAQWFEDTWNAIVQWFSDLWQSIADWAVGCWNSIVDAWNACGEWFDTNIIQPVKNFFEGLWDGISDGAKNAWQWVVDTWNNLGNWFNDHIVKPIANFFGGLWNGIQNGASTLAGWIKTYVIDPIVSAFKWLYNSVVGIIEGVINGFIGIINGFINGINWVIDTINHIPGVNLGKIGTMEYAHIPRLAKGAVLKQPTYFEGGEYAGAQSNPEIVAPQSIMEETVIKANTPLVTALSGKMDAIIAAIHEIDPSIQIGDDVIYSSAIRGGRRQSRRTNKPAFGV